MILALLGCGDPPFEVHLSQTAANRDLRAEATLEATFSWTVDGIEAGSGERIAARSLRPGQSWSVTATTEDGLSKTASLSVPEPPGGNVLVLLLDDIGNDKLDIYDGAYAASTPRINALADEGIVFDRAYAAPVCSPTRGILLTGRHARRHQLGWIVDTGNRRGQLPLTTTTIPEALPEAWSNSAVGKWHLAGPNLAGWLDHPNDSGFDWYAGSPGNPDYAAGRGYYNWDRNENGTVTVSQTYMTVDSVNTALARIEAMPEPWFLYVSFNAAHGPLNVPPQELRPHGEPLTGEDPRHLRFNAIVEVLDSEIGRMMDSIDPAVLARTTTLIIGDNGTAPNGLPEDGPWERVKHTPYEGGIRVPFVVNGPLVAQPGSRSDALIHVADVLPTVMHIAGVPLEGEEGEILVAETDVLLDGRSLLPFLADPSAPGRDTVYTEAFYPNGSGPYGGDRRALQNATHKLIRWDDQVEFYRLEGPQRMDTTDLLRSGELSADDQVHFDSLSFELDLLQMTLQTPLSF